MPNFHLINPDIRQLVAIISASQQRKGGKTGNFVCEKLDSYSDSPGNTVYAHMDGLDLGLDRI